MIYEISYALFQLSKQWNKVLHGKLIVVSLAKKCLPFMEPECVHKIPLLVPNHSPMNPIHSITLYFSKTYFNIPSVSSLCLWLPTSQIPSGFQTKLFCAFYISLIWGTCPVHPTFDDPHNIWWSVQTMKLLIM